MTSSTKYDERSLRRVLVLFSFFAPFVCATIPDVILTVDRVDDGGDDNVVYNIDPLYVKRAAFGSTDDVSGELVLAPSYDAHLCELYNTSRNEPLPQYSKPTYDTIMLAARGHCTFEHKAHAAKQTYGAKAVLIYDEPSARYGFEGNETEGHVIYPAPIWDYDCNKGLNVLNESLPLDPPAYNGSVMDPLMDMTKTETSICTLMEERQPCESQLCLVISRIPNTTLYPVCCAWDVPLTMPRSNDTEELDTGDIVALFLTIRQGEQIMNTDLLGRQVVIQSRGKIFNISYIFMWILGTLVVARASWYAAGDYRIFGSKLAAYKERTNRANHRNTVDRSHPPSVLVVNHNPADGTNNTNESHRNAPERERSQSSNTMTPDVESAPSTFLDEVNDSSAMTEKNGNNSHKEKASQHTHRASHSKKGHAKNQEVMSLHSIPPRRKQNQNNDSGTDDSRPVFVINFRRNGGDSGDNRNFHSNQPNATNTESVENNYELEPPELAARESGRMKSFEMNQWHVLIFIVTASLLLILLFFFQFYTIIFVLYGIGCAGAVSYLVFNPLVKWFFPKFGDGIVEEMNKKVVCGLNGFDVSSQLPAYVWAAIWIWFGVTKYRPETNPFFWLSMDFFGICFCFVTMSILKLNSIKIATLLMVAIFIYDIFFVFITPFLTGGDSIMLTVAGGGNESGWADYCYRYPDERDCRGINFLPMLLLLPRVNDYADGSVILGLGDIILPGFLMAFCARYDEACRLVDANMTNTGVDAPRKWYQGFLFPMIVAYCVGLLIAFVAVLGMEQGQPALLYIVPTCLGTMFLMGRNDLTDLWSGARAIILAEQLIERTERSWGKARMKRFVERRRRENAGAAGESLDDPDDAKEEMSVDLVSNSMDREEPDPDRPSIDDSGLENEHVSDAHPHPLRRHSKDRVNPGHKHKDQHQHQDTKFHHVANEDVSNPNPDAYTEPKDQPTPHDVCFGVRDHTGTIELQRAVKNAYDTNDGAEFNPQIFKSIRKDMVGRDYYCQDGDSISWRKATKMEIRDEMWKMYEDYRFFLAHQK